jgi:hypothetical protein
MKSLLCFLVLHFVFNSAHSQTDAIGDFNKHVIEKWSEDFIRISQYKVKGSPYLLGESFDGALTVKSGIVAANQKILYDLYSQKVGIEINKELIKPDGEVVSFYIQLPEKFGNERLEFINASTLKNVKLEGYLNTLEKGNKLILLRQYKTRVIADPANMYSKDFRIFEQYYDYFIYNVVTSSLEKIRLKQKDVISALNGLPSSIINAAEGSNLNSLSSILDFVKKVNGN